MGAAGQLQAAQEFGHGGNFVAFLGGAQLAEHEPVARGPCADQVHGAAARPAAAAQGFAVEGDDFAGQRLAQTLRPSREGLGELRGIQRGEDPPEGVVAGNAVGQFEQAAQPLALGFAELLPAPHRRAISAKPSAPQSSAQMEMIRMSPSAWRLERSMRGSVSWAKCLMRLWVSGIPSFCQPKAQKYIYNLHNNAPRFDAIAL